MGNGKRKRAMDAAADTGAGDINLQDKDYTCEFAEAFKAGVINWLDFSGKYCSKAN